LDNWARFRRFARKMRFSNFSVLCGCCWWKLLVRCKTLIYCGQLCNNAVNYPSNPLTVASLFPWRGWCKWRIWHLEEDPMIVIVRAVIHLSPRFIETPSNRAIRT
jgi:hypothetical protein